MDHGAKRKTQTTKFLGDNMEENLDVLGNGDNFLDTALKTQSMKEIIDKMDFIKIKNSSPWLVWLSGSSVSQGTCLGCGPGPQ